MSAKIPLGIFWDIENCAIPNNKSVSSCVKQIRDFIADKRQLCGFAKEFCFAVFNLGMSLSEGLDKNGVNVVHVNNTAKNAAEDKLQELIDMFIDKYGGTGSAVLCIISSDINLAKQIRIRNARRKDLDVLLIHGINCSVDLKNLANDYHLYEDIIKRADNTNKTENQIKPAYLEISNLPIDKPSKAIRKSLTDMSANCGGKPESIVNEKGFIRFGCLEDAQRCLSRINGTDVYGSKILVKLCNKPAKGQVAQSNNGSTGSKQKKIKPKSGLSFEFTLSGDITDDMLSVIYGFDTKPDQNLATTVRKLVMKWNDREVQPNYIKDVKYFPNCSEVYGKRPLLVIANSKENNKGLVSGAEKHLKPNEGIVWIHLKSDQKLDETIIPNKREATQPKTTVEERQKFSDKSAKQQNLEGVCAGSSIGIKSVIYGFETKVGQNLTKFLRKKVMKWKDNNAQANFIIDVIRYPGYPEADGMSPLLVIASSKKNNKALVSGAAKHLKPNGGVVWTYLKYDQKLDEQHIPKRTEVTEKLESEFEFRTEQSIIPTTVEVSQQFSDKPAEQQNLSEVCVGSSPGFESVIYGFETKTDQNLAKIIRKLVMDWNDVEVRPNYINYVMRFPGYPKVDGKSPLLVITNSEKSNNALVSGAVKHLNPNEGIVWTHLKTDQKLLEIESVLTKDRRVDFPLKTTETKDDNKNQNISDELISIIKGLDTKRDTNVTELVRQMVKEWNDSEVEPDFIKLVERDRKFKDKDGEALLFVTATSPQTCAALVIAANKHWTTGTVTNDLKWSRYQRTDTTTEITVDMKSIIYGFETKIGQNLAKIIRKLVIEWNDREVQSNYIKDVMRFPGYPELDGKSPLLVIANSEKSNKALVSGAAKHLNANEGIVWTHLKSDQKLDDELIPKPLEVTVKEETDIVAKPEESTKPKTTVRVKPMLTSDSTEDFEVLSLESKPQPTLSYIPIPITSSNRQIPEPIPRGVSADEKNIFKSLITGFEGLFKSKKSSQKPENLSKPVPNTDLIQNPTVPFNCSIGNIIKSGLIIHFNGRINTGPHEGFTLEFRADSDVAFHFDVRLTQLLVVRNTKTNGNWGHEERQYGSYPFVLGQDFNAMIRIFDQKYMVYINGQHLCDFEHRIPLNRVNNLSIFGDIAIHWFKFAQN